ncbi:DUF1194 domain-containing protein [Sulfitobacter sp. M57]|uniref:DUF1194 domain-containing protein n=1 Tax=unclassified Sulfitobacter TaxID=196795 RepID=UPI0023E2B392|nr:MULTISPECIES: DUF1194 domain-containing protein [unclassified Sulfitobacter]MDF3413100.1 DUF1194 domain-containing protein [Sulfitobacter sp. KE5]MDF3421617.1 DUF1194 domain-containing protein [Sulfitobacter sp. KE43]MDF3431649.1 DUF1194 domain-containing protein [Sulfitobacter sp. KE42]MDF3457290.1 DUF1194 domain-containing protein [Sulfitobacter sp. S74]MDF3461192.1 DUF1194 domain-containing protein [Sulfitobacter sp. Ks18]
MMRTLALAAGMAVAATSAVAECRQALALGLDVSGSVDAREYRLQLDGLATALNAPQVRDKLMVMPAAPVRLMVYEWSGPSDQAVVVPWTVIDNATALDGIIATLRATQRRDASPGTALGVAMSEGARHLHAQGRCWKRTLDLSGDGKSNLGPRPRDMQAHLSGSGITINALVIGVDDPQTGDIRQAEIAELSSYFRAEVVLGQDAFVQTALGFTDYARAMTQKLMRELEGLVLSGL